MKYATLAELREAYRFPEGNGRPEPLSIDNDSAAAWDEDGEVKVFEMHPAQLMEEALALLGIPFEHV
jgi:hypothetical protein